MTSSQQNRKPQHVWKRELEKQVRTASSRYSWRRMETLDGEESTLHLQQ